MFGKLISKICPIFMVPENNPVNEEKYLGNRKNDFSIYEKNDNKNIYPIIKFKNEDSVIEKLCLIDFKGDSIYKTIELQQVKEGNNIYYIVLMARIDSGTDIYYSKELKLTEDKYKSLLNEVNLFEKDSMEVHFDASEKGIDVYLAIQDRENRLIEFKIKEDKKENDVFGLIAPVGVMSEKPDKFPLIYLKKFNMVEQKHTDIFVKVDGESLTPMKLFPLCNFKKVYYARYSYFNNIKELNNNYAGIMEPIKATEDMDEINVDNCNYSIHMNAGHPEIKCVKNFYNNSEMRITFSPPIPDFISLKNNTKILGHFSVSVDEVKGIMGGVYSLRKNNDLINMQINPQKGWQPMPGKLWMSTYLWNCDIKLVGDKLEVDSKWSREK